MLRRLGLGDELVRLGADGSIPSFAARMDLMPRRCGRRSLPSQIEFYGMHRADLLAMFVDRLPAGVVQTGHRCVGFEQDDGRRSSRSPTARASRPTS